MTNIWPRKSLVQPVMILSLCLILFQSAQSQTTSVTGIVSEFSSGDKIPYANVYFKNTTIGSITDTSGMYQLSTDKQIDSIVVSVLGYKPITLPVKNGKTQSIDFKLTSTIFDLSEVIVNPGENPAWSIMRKIIANKLNNNPDSKESYQYEEYSKVQFDLNHFTEKIKNNIILRPFDFIWDHVDSTDDGVAYLPILLIENISEHYYESKRHRRKEIVIAHQSTGLEGPKIMAFVEDMYIHPNLYNNYVQLLEKNFPSPLNDNYKSNYRFYLTDSIQLGNETYYEIAFKPRSFNAHAFEGQMLIHKGSYALKEISLRFDIRANVNFVRSYWIKQNFEAKDGENWMLSSSKLIGDFTLLENQSEMTGFYGRKSTVIKNLKVNEIIPDTVFKGVDDVVIQDNAEDRNSNYWKENRYENLTTQEQGIYAMVEQIEADPAFITRKKIVNTIWNGYYPMKYIDLGDVYTFYSYNQVEYSRFKLGFKTNENLFKNTTISAFTAYGDRDNTFKYGGKLEHIFRGEKNRFVRLGGLYRYDIEQLGWSYNFVPIDNAIASLIQVNISKTRTYNERAEIYVDRQWFTGFNTRLTAFSHDITPTAGLEFRGLQGSDTIQYSNFAQGGGKFTIRYAQGVKETNGDYYSPTQKWKFTAIPIISAEFKFGSKGILGSEFDFQEVKIRLDHRLKFKKWGYTNYLIEAGKVWGVMPYHFLEIPIGNEVIIYDRIAYNLINYLEFINDEFAQLQLEHHFEGILFSVVPLVKKTKLRSLVFGKVMAGSIRPENDNGEFLFNQGSNIMIQPYYEVGFGIENIIKIARIDFIWRLNYLDNVNIYPFIVKPSFQFNF